MCKVLDPINVKQDCTYMLLVITATEYGYKREDGVYVIPIGCLKN